jgi:hypothetical protein
MSDLMSQIVDSTQYSYGDYSQQDSQTGMYVEGNYTYRNNTLPAIEEEEPYFGNNNPQNNKQKQLQKLEVISQEIDNIESNMETQEINEAMFVGDAYKPETRHNPKHQLIANYQQSLNINNNNVNNNTNSYQNSKTPTKYNSNILNEFNENFNNQVRKVIDMYDQFKLVFCNNIDEAKRKFLYNTDQIREIVINDTERILDSEERNRELDMKMMIVYKELQNVMNEFKNFN